VFILLFIVVFMALVGIMVQPWESLKVGLWSAFKIHLVFGAPTYGVWVAGLFS